MGVLERVRELGIAQGGDGHEDVRQRRRELRDRLKRGLVERLGLSEVAALVGDGASELVREELAVACRAVLNEDGFSEMDADERDGLVRQVIDEVVGLGPLQPLLDDPTISEVMVNGCASVMAASFPPGRRSTLPSRSCSSWTASWRRSAAGWTTRVPS